MSKSKKVDLVALNKIAKQQQEEKRYWYLVNDEGNLVTESMQQDMYDEMLDDCYGEVTICGYKYAASRALKFVDEVAYDCGFSDYHSSLIEDGYEEKSLTRAEAANYEVA